MTFFPQGETPQSCYAQCFQAVLYLLSNNECTFSSSGCIYWVLSYSTNECRVWIPPTTKVQPSVAHNSLVPFSNCLHVVVHISFFLMLPYGFLSSAQSRVSAVSWCLPVRDCPLHRVDQYVVSGTHRGVMICRHTDARYAHATCCLARLICCSPQVPLFFSRGEAGFASTTVARHCMQR
jgi:hypothetical protein